MEFDKSKVYTSFDVDEVKFGSSGYFADSKNSLIARVASEDKSYYSKMIRYNEDNHDYPFCSNMCGSAYRYFYLVEEPQEPAKRPCTRKELVEMLKKQGLSLLKEKNAKDNYTVDIRDFTDSEITLENGSCFKDYKGLCEQYTLLDGTPLWVEE